MRNQKLLTILFLTFYAFLLLGSSAQAEKSPPINPYASIEEIPEVLKEHIRDEFPEQFIYQMLQYIRKHTENKTVLTKTDIEKVFSEEEREAKQHQLRQLFPYDGNFDGKISKQEVLSYLEDKNKQRKPSNTENAETIFKKASAIMEADLDKDGIITLQEMTFIKKEDDKKWNLTSERLSALLALEENGDGVLSVGELEKLAWKAFLTADRDGDGALSPNEKDILKGLKPQNAACDLPKALPNERLVVIEAQEGSAVATVSVAGQLGMTTVIPVHILSGDEKLYIVASAFHPIIWQLTGDVKRVSRFVMGAYHWNGANSHKEGAGVVGLSKEQVSFMDVSNCVGAGISENEAISDIRAKAIQSVTGSSSVSSFSSYKVSQVALDGSKVKVTKGDSPTVPVPEGYDSAAWQVHVQSMPDGVATLDAEKIISKQAAVPYEVLPAWAGIAKLVHEGILVPEGPTAFKVVKDIKYLPSGLKGIYTTNFVVSGFNIPEYRCEGCTLAFGYKDAPKENESTP